VLRHQKRATYLKTWVDKVSGMWCMHGEFDPETGVRLHGRLNRTIEKLFHDTTPETAPQNPLDKQHRLRALSLVALVDGEGARPEGSTFRSSSTRSPSPTGHTLALSSTAALASNCRSRPSGGWRAWLRSLRSSLAPTA